jgi:hypothetical protein
MKGNIKTTQIYKPNSIVYELKIVVWTAIGQGDTVLINLLWACCPMLLLFFAVFP